MRLVTGKDFYDTALTYGFDADVVFVRHKEKLVQQDALGVTIPLQLFLERYRDHVIQRDRSEWHLHLFAVVFCGQIYQGIHAEGFELDRLGYSRADHTLDRFFYDYDKFCSWVVSKGRDPLKLADRAWRWKLTAEQALRGHFTRKLTDAEIKALLDARVSIATMHPLQYREDVRRHRYTEREPHWRIDGDNLRSFQFYQVLPAPTAFQELSMWVGGTLPKDGPPMVEITDQNVKIAKHGFNKFSFRKGKEQK